MVPSAGSKCGMPRYECYKIMANVEFSKHKQWYSDHVSYPANYLQFVLRNNCNGDETIEETEIKDDETPEDLKMKDNDVIEVHFAVPVDDKNRKIFLSKQRR